MHCDCAPRRPADLARYTLLRADDEPWLPWFEAAGLGWPEPTRGPLFNDSAHNEAAAEGPGVALVRATSLGDDERNGVLVRPFAIEAPAPRRFYVVYPARSTDAPKIAAFRAWLQAEIAADRTSTLAQRTPATAAPASAVRKSPRPAPLALKREADRGEW